VVQSRREKYRLVKKNSLVKPTRVAELSNGNLAGCINGNVYEMATHFKRLVCCIKVTRYCNLLSRKSRLLTAT